MARDRRIWATLGWELICPDHRHYGSRPCPWPGCKNGVVESSLIEQIPGLPAVSDADARLVRVAWPPIDDEPYFSWQNEAMPYWFGLQSVVGREVWRRLQLAIQQYPTIYHYTSTAALKSIVESRSMWLTDYAFVNDARELHHGLEVTQKYIEKLLAEKPGEKFAGLLSEWAQKLEPGQIRVHLACFSLERDSLSQWRAYGSVALGLAAFADPFGYIQGETLIDRVLYEPSHQEMVVRIYCRHAMASLELDLARYGDQVRSYYASVVPLYRLLALFKDRSFADEREARYVYIEDSTGAVKGHNRALTHFRVSGNLLIPYIDSSDIVKEQPDKLRIREVVIGPQANADLLEAALRQFLLSNGYDKVKLTRSSIPYRALPIARGISG
jgi:hypothetical protein